MANSRNTDKYSKGGFIKSEMFAFASITPLCGWMNNPNYPTREFQCRRCTIRQRPSECSTFRDLDGTSYLLCRRCNSIMELTDFNLKDPVMLFDPFLIDKVLSGEKTVTRRLAKSPKCKYHPGSICSIKTNVDSDSLGFIEIVDVKKEVLGQLTSKEAINDRASYSKEPRVPCAL